MRTNRRTLCNRAQRSRRNNRRVNEDWALQVICPADAPVTEQDRVYMMDTFFGLIKQIEDCFEATADNTLSYIATTLRSIAQMTSSIVARYTTDYDVVYDEDEGIEICDEVADEEDNSTKNNRRRR